MHACLDIHDDHLLLRIKVVPGASRDAIAGPLGDRLKIRVSAPPESGKANDAMLRLLARTLEVPRAQLEIVAGRTSPEKIVRIDGLTRSQAAHRLALPG
jgi:uncharacterized protein (TIGR00251 family)